MHGEPVRSCLPRFDQLDHPIAVPVAVEKPKRRGLVKFINGIAPPVATGQVHAPVPVKVAGDHTRPPARPVGQSPLGGPLFKVAWPPACPVR